eukprot:Protomagalhaensia_wolfi_Nauph_80__335@NODE_1187_length_1669_cov_19_718405_g911_i0_p2_GENE_NODE_1187_length_1669_cov_19_718405_g911_i0NODE_1187_length_1669_cov_19_718405_g911_i0_p2_ORF_typecomplete_len178_score24_27_NODE_1187_length_1669_cov_19_718405_g911_i028561
MGLYNITAFDAFQRHLVNALEYHFLQVINEGVPPTEKSMEVLDFLVGCLQCCPRVTLVFAHGLNIQMEAAKRGRCGLGTKRWLWAFTSAMRDVELHMNSRIRQTAVMFLSHGHAATPKSPCAFLRREVEGMITIFGTHKVVISTPYEFEVAERCLYILNELWAAFDEIEDPEVRRID